jgi:ABC-type nickel/cobalt efflux system permease component RcnA
MPDLRSDHPFRPPARTLVVMGRRTIRAFLAVVAIAVALVAARPVDAHPLGNFTINHFAGVTIAPEEIRLDVVVDLAEIPTFQERQRIDIDGDGSVSDAEAAAARGPACAERAKSLRLAVGGAAVTPEPTSAAISFPSGLGGLSTMRIECGYVARLATPLAAGTAIAFEDVSDAERIGWREIVATGDGVTLEADGLPAMSPSKRLTAYPQDLISQPLDIRSATIMATAVAAGPGQGQGGAMDHPALPGGVSAVPGGIGAELPPIFREADLTPIVLLLSIATAFALGAGHALTPGHGKTLMAAYLVGTKGTAVHAVGLGLSITVSHTIGILVIAGLVVGAQGLLPPDAVVRAAPAVAAVTIAGLGGWMLLTELRRRRAVRQAANAHAHAHEHGLSHEHGLDHDHGHHADNDHDEAAGTHRHGGVSHSHLPPSGSTLSWRGLFALGLAGGLIPSTSALFILLGSIVAGRPAFGFVLVVIFGLGMAAVMTAVGLIVVAARGRLDAVPSGSGLGRVARFAPLAAAVVVFAVGIYLSIQTIASQPVI